MAGINSPSNMIENRQLEALILYAKDYINDDFFIPYAFENIEEYEKLLDENAYNAMLSVSLANKESLFELKKAVGECVNAGFPGEYALIDDDYEMDFLSSDRDDPCAAYIKQKYKREELAVIDCAGINSDKDLIEEFLSHCKYPDWCSRTFDGMNDMLSASFVPKKVIFKDWGTLERELPHAASAMKSIMETVKHQCEISYE